MSDTVVVVLFYLWLPVMISVPLVAARATKNPDRADFFRSTAISGGVVFQVLLVIGTLFVQWPAGFAVRAVVLVPLLGWLAEFIGSRTGIPFGNYHYTAVLQPQIHRVPVAIPLAWLMMLPPSWAVAHLLAPNGTPLVHAVVAGLAFTAWDIYLDPHLVKWGFWEWRQKGAYEGIPLRNFLGWFLWATVITWVAAPPALDFFPLVLVYLLTWLFQFGGHMVFWGWPVSGIAGFIAMGAAAVPALLRYFL